MKKTFFRMRRCQTSPCFSTSSLNQNATLINVAFPATFRHVAFFFFLCMNSLLFSTTWQIKLDGTGNFTTIQAGIDASANSDTVLVYPGTYYENINYSGKNITVASLELTTGDPQYISQTVIDGQRLSSCVAIVSNEINITIRGFTITNGQGFDNYPLTGGGISIYDENNILTCNITNCSILRNFGVGGAGIAIWNSIVNLSGTTIHDNFASRAGGAIGIMEDCEIIFDEDNRCNIYNNLAAYFSEIYMYSLYFNEFSIIVDTFTVQEPTDYFVGHTSGMPIQYNYDILHNYLEPIDNDLYVSPDGDDNNSGLTANDPLKTINLAVRNIASNSDNPRIVHLAAGEYKNSTNPLQLPFGSKSFVNIIGDGKNTTILDAENNGEFFLGMNGLEHTIIQNFSMINGNFVSSLFLLYYSDYITINNISIADCIITDYGAALNSATAGGNIELINVDVKNIVSQNCDVGGCLFNGTSSFFAKESLFLNNTANYDRSLSAGLYVMSSGDITIDNCKFISNTATSTESMGYASALLCYDYNDVIGDTYINNCLFTDNYNIGGKSTIFAKSLDNSTVNFTNNTVVDNHSNYGIEFMGNIECTNNIIRNMSYYEIALLDQTNQGIISEIDIAYNNIELGQNAIYNQNNVNIVNWLEGNIDEDPLFLLSGDDPYQLTELSPCIDAGTPDTTGLYLPPWDLLNNQRILDGDGNGEAVIDMGCYEYGAALASGFIAGIVTNQNGTVLENAEITAGNYTTTTDENGAYQVEVIVGNYSVSCYLEDYAIPDEIEVTVNLGETSYANFILVPGVNADDPLPEAGIRFTNYPNPFNPETTISFSVTQSSAFATIEIFNIKGQKVKTLMECQVSAGDFNCIWKGRDDNGKRVSSGTYIARLKLDGKETATRKIMLLK